MTTEVDSYRPLRPIMTQEEMNGARREVHGRDFHNSDNGYDDMELNERAGWSTLASWGADGWDMGEWPYVVYSIRENDATRRFELLEVCEGDHSRWSFSTRYDLYAALDMILWISNENVRAAALNLPDDETYDAKGYALPIPADLDKRFRGPYGKRRSQI